MSDPMSTREIEDVLSSIRRLVSQDNPPSSAPAVAPAPGRGRLVLTEAQRVHDAPAGAADKEPQAVAGPPAVSVERPGHSRTAGTEPEEGAGGPAGAGTADSAPDHEESRASLEKTIAELEAAVASSGGNWDPDEGDAAPQEVPAPPGQSLHAPEQVDTDAEGGHATAGSEGFVSTRIHPGAGGADTMELPAAQWEDAEPQVPTAQPDTALDEVIDEAALREMVEQIVREELQGRLGERITRNVRKLVRSEIARALASRDLG